VFQVLLWTTGAFAASYYVNGRTGNDNNTGTSAQPFKTIARAVTAVAAGDTVVVNSGAYNERVIITKSGTSSQPITFKAARDTRTLGFSLKGNYLSVTGFEVSTVSSDVELGTGFWVSGNYITVSGNFIHDTTRGGIRMDSPDTGSTRKQGSVIYNNVIYRAGQVGIEVHGLNVTIEGNEIRHTIQHPAALVPDSSFEDADGMRFFGEGHIFRKNYIHDITTNDPENDDSPHIDCFQTWGPATRITFDSNTCINDNETVQGFMIETSSNNVSDITVTNNVVYAFRALNVWSCPRIYIANNTFAGRLSFTGPSGYGVELHNSPNSTIYNNIFYDMGHKTYWYLYTDAASRTNTVINYNLIYNSDGSVPPRNPGSQYPPYPFDKWNADPGFVNPAGYDYRLKSTSLARDAGTTLSGVDHDIKGIRRPQGNGHDIGAFEYVP
jgi:hypothetical protein